MNNTPGSNTTQEYPTENLTWRQLRDYLNSIKDEAVLDTAVIAQEHHHGTYEKFNPIIQVRLDDERRGMEEANEFDKEEYKQKCKLFLESDAPEYKLDHPKQPNLSLQY